MTAKKRDGKKQKVAFLRLNRDQLTCVNRAQELKLVKTAGNAGISAKFLFDTPNGFCTSYIYGRNVNEEALMTDTLLNLALESLGKFGRLLKGSISH